MKIYRGLRRFPSTACALTIGNFDGMHLGHQAMLAALKNAAQDRRLPTCVLTFEPHPLDYFARLRQQADLAPARIVTLRDKLDALAACGIDHAAILPFNARLAALSPQAFVQDVLLSSLHARYVLVGDDFRFGAQRAGDYALLKELGSRHGFEVAQTPTHTLDGQRTSSTAVRKALQQGRIDVAATLLGRPYSISGHVVHGRKLGRDLGFPTLNLRFSHWKAAACGIFVVQVHGLTDDDTPLPGVANMGIRPSLDPNDVNGGRVLLETYCLQWPSTLGQEGGYGKIIRVELLHKLHDERKYANLDALQQGIAQDCADARNWFAQNRTPNHAQTRRQTTRDRI